MRLFLNSVSAGLVLSAAAFGCKPPATSDVKAVVGVAEDGREAAMGIVAVRNWTDVPASKKASTNDAIRYAEGLIRLPFMAIVECKTMDDGGERASAEIQMLAIESLSLANNLFVDKDRNLVAFTPDNPDKLSPTSCWMVRDREGKLTRLLSWRVILESSIRAGGIPEVRPRDETTERAVEHTYLVAQASYLALRGSYIDGEKPDAATPMLGKLLGMAKADEGINPGKVADMKQRFAVADRYFNPCVSDAGTPWYVKEYRNRNFACTPIQGRPGMKNFRAGGLSGHEYTRVRSLLAFEAGAIHDDLYGKEARKPNPNKAVALWDALTSGSKWSEVKGAGKGFGRYLADLDGGTNLEEAFENFTFASSEETGFGLTNPPPQPWYGPSQVNWGSIARTGFNYATSPSMSTFLAREGVTRLASSFRSGSTGTPTPSGSVRTSTPSGSPATPRTVPAPPRMSPSAPAALAPAFQPYANGTPPAGVDVTRHFYDFYERESIGTAAVRNDANNTYRAIGTQGNATVYRAPNGDVAFQMPQAEMQRALAAGQISQAEYNANVDPTTRSARTMWDQETINVRLNNGQTTQIRALEHTSIPHGTAANGNDFGEYQFTNRQFVTPQNPTGLAYAYRFAEPGDGPNSPVDIVGPARAPNGYFQPAPDGGGPNGGNVNFGASPTAIRTAGEHLTTARAAAGLPAAAPADLAIATRYQAAQEANQRAYQSNTANATSWGTAADGRAQQSESDWNSAGWSPSGIASGVSSYYNSALAWGNRVVANGYTSAANGNLTDARNNQQLAVASRDDRLREAGALFNEDCFRTGTGTGGIGCGSVGGARLALTCDPSGGFGSPPAGDFTSPPAGDFTSPPAGDFMTPPAGDFGSSGGNFGSPAPMDTPMVDPAPMDPVPPGP